VREQERRQAEDERIQDRLHKLREEAAASGRANAAVQLKWADILERNLPQELAAELATQREACAAILGSKDALLAQLTGELAHKDDEYVRSLQQQREDIEKLVTRMTAQFKDLSRSYEAELAAMEAAFLQVRPSRHCRCGAGPRGPSSPLRTPYFFPSPTMHNAPRLPLVCRSGMSCWPRTGGRLTACSRPGAAWRRAS